MASFYQEIRTHPSIDFTKSGWRQFAKLNRNLGARFIRAFILKRDLADYIAAHEARGIHLDMGCQEIRYDDGIHLIIKKVQGVWSSRTSSPRKRPPASRPSSSGSASKWA